jgi:hypothetical protein
MALYTREYTKVAEGWQSESMAEDVTGRVADLEELVPELNRVCKRGRDPVAIEPILGSLTVLASLPLVEQWTREPITSLSRSQAICDVVWRAVERLPDTVNGQVAKLLFGADPTTKELAPADARRHAAEAKRVELRQFRGRHEEDLFRLVAQHVLQLQVDEDRLNGARRMMVGASVPQTVGMYWLQLFADHYFRLETSAYALQMDVTTALQRRRHGMDDWRQYAQLAVWWNVEFSYYRERFFLQHGPLWFTPTDEGGTALNDCVEAIEYHDAFPEEYMSQLRTLCSRLESITPEAFLNELRESGRADEVNDRFARWLDLCHCPDEGPVDENCEVHIVLGNCDRLGEVVEHEFTLIQNWYRTEQYAVDQRIRQKILNFRLPATEQRSWTVDPSGNESAEGSPN